MNASREIYAGDRVIDRLDGSLREVSDVTEQTVHLADGGVMGREEISSVFLPGEKVVRTTEEDARWSETLHEMAEAEERFFTFGHAA